MGKKDDRLSSALHTAAAGFINRESNRRSLITVTRVDWPEGEKQARVFLSVFPQNQTTAAMDFISRQHAEFMAFLRKSVKLHVLPQVTFLPDPEMGTIEKGEIA